MKIVIIGGQGGHEVVAASPNTGVNTITGEGLKEAMAGTQVVIDLANSASFQDRAVLRGSAGCRSARGGSLLGFRLQPMTRRPSIVRMATSAVIAVSAGVLMGASASFAAGASASSASDEGIFLDLTRALPNVAEMSLRRSLSPEVPEVRTEDPPRRGTDFILLGAIGGETRLALV